MDDCVDQGLVSPRSYVLGSDEKLLEAAMQEGR